MPLRTGAALSTLTDSVAAAREAGRRAVEALDGEIPDLSVFFHSPHHLDNLDEAVAAMMEEVAPGPLIGCTTEAALGEGLEVEDGPSMSVWTAHLGGAPVESFSVSVEQMPDGEAIVGFPLIDKLARGVLLLADPYSFPILDLLAQLSADYPGMPVVGGMASGPPRQNAFVLDYLVSDKGGVGVALGPPVSLQTIVSQGCKPVGEALIVTAAEGNVITGLAGKPPLERMRDIAARMHPSEQASFVNGPLIGLLADEYSIDPGQGDFIVRNILQADLETGALAVGGHVFVGQTVQFHNRDAHIADRELEMLLKSHREPPAAGALVFTCNGRGTRMFPGPNHDAQALDKALGIPHAGMFCAGEIGPIGGQSVLHAFTASIALLTATE